MTNPLWYLNYASGSNALKRFLDSTSTDNQENTMKLQLDHIDLAGIRYEGPIDVQFNNYVEGRGLAIQLIEHSGGYPEMLATVTVNVPGETPAPGAVFVKNYSENEGVLEAFVEKGWFKITGRTVRSGWVTIPEAELAGDLLKRAWPFDDDAEEVGR